MATATIEVRTAGGIRNIAAAAWDRLAPEGNPFLAHAFLHVLEASGSAAETTGWQPCHLVVEEGQRLLAAAPLYAKSHSYGEYVFDWEWAHVGDPARDLAFSGGPVHADPWYAPMDERRVRAQAYDLACNGYELISGGIRNHTPEIMFKAFEIAGYPASEVEKRFGGMVKAFRYGAPPHGGCAAGIDRIVMLLADEQNIREVIMFPMNQRAEDLMMGAPSEPTNEQMRELRLRALPKDA